MLIDVHCHLEYFNEPQIKEIVRRCKENKVGILISNAQDLASMKKTLSFSKTFKEIYFCLGLHPVNVARENFEECKNFILQNIKNEKMLGIGEVGLDFKYAESLEEKNLQKKIFLKQLDIAAKHNLALEIHSRRARKEVLSILQKFVEENPAMRGKILLHWFTGNKKELSNALKLSCFISINSNVLFSKSYAKYVAKLPLENTLLETDSPVVYNNQKAMPFWIKKICEKVSKLKNISFEKLEEICFNNACKLFGKKLEKFYG